MTKNVENYIRNNFSLLLILIGAVSNFLLILYLNKYLPQIFDLFSLYLTFIGIIASFGYLGLDQVFLRLSKRIDNKIVIGKDLYIILIFVLFFSPIMLSFYFNSRYEQLPFYLMLISGISVNAIILAYNFFRLQKKFILSQSFKAGYSVMFLLGISLFSVLFSFGLKEILILTTTVLAIFGLATLYFVFGKIEIQNKKTKSLFSFFISFFINIGLITLIGFGERILIANELGEETFGKYFYYSTIFLFPLTLLQQYIGFKELVFFKDKLERRLILKKLARVFVFGSVMIICLIILVKIDGGFLLNVDIGNEKMLITLLCVFGLVKVCYSLFSAIIGARGEFRDIYLINGATVIFSTLYLVYIYSTEITVNKIIIGLILVYIIRSLIIHLKYAK